MAVTTRSSAAARSLSNRKSSGATAAAAATTTTTVLVTGAEGYVAGVLIRELLDRGCTVHGTVWGAADSDAVAHLHRLAQTYDDNNHDNSGSSSSSGLRLKLFGHCDLLKNPAAVLDAAMAGCSVVLHTASPFLLRHNMDVQKCLIDPAVHGTRHVLEAVSRTPSVTRVVQTSSVGAMYADATDSIPNVITSDVWNTTSTLEHQPYFLSKTLAERTAWDMAAKEEQQYTLIVLNPALILGPGIQCHLGSESFRTLLKLGSGRHWTMLTGVPDFAMPMVDVRDVAVAHATAALDMSVPSGRYILSATNINHTKDKDGDTVTDKDGCASLADMASLLRRRFPDYPIPGCASIVPKWIAWLVVPYTGQGLDRLTVQNNLNVPRIRLDAGPSLDYNLIQGEYRKPIDTLSDMYQSLIDDGHVQPGWRPELVGLAIVAGILAAVVGCIGGSSAFVDGWPGGSPNSG